jgi:hypothetical protein
MDSSDGFEGETRRPMHPRAVVVSHPYLDITHLLAAIEN